MLWKFHHPRMTAAHLGFIPTFLDDRDPRPAAEQIHQNYAHGGGWSPFKGFTMNEDGSISYPGDPTHPMLAEARFHEFTDDLPTEIIRYYDFSWLAIVQPDGSYEISRLD